MTSRAHRHARLCAEAAHAQDLPQNPGTYQFQAGVSARIRQKMPLSTGGREYEGTGQQVPGQRADKPAELRGDMPAAPQSAELRGDKTAATQFYTKLRLYGNVDME